MVRVRVGVIPQIRGAACWWWAKRPSSFTFGEVVRHVGDAVYKTSAFWRGVRREWAMVSIGLEA